MKVTLDMSDETLRRNVREMLQKEWRSMIKEETEDKWDKAVISSVDRYYNRDAIEKVTEKLVNEHLRVGSWNGGNALRELAQFHTREILLELFREKAMELFQNEIATLNVERAFENIMRREIKQQLDGLKLNIKLGPTKEQSDLWAAIQQLQVDVDGKENTDQTKD